MSTARVVHHRIGLLAAAALLLTSWTGLAHAGGWADTMNPEAVASYLDVRDAAVMVVGAGASDGDLAGAVEALTAALRDSGATKLVMDAAALGDVASLDDAAIVAKAAAFPVDRVVVVRVFPAGDAVSGVATFYDKDGSARNAAAMVRGDALAAAAGSETGSGVSAGVASAVGEVVSREGGDGEGGGAPRVWLRTDDEGERELDSSLAWLFEGCWTRFCLAYPNSASEMRTHDREPILVIESDSDPQGSVYIGEAATDTDDGKRWIGISNLLLFLGGHQPPIPDDIVEFRTKDLGDGLWGIRPVDEMDWNEEYALFLYGRDQDDDLIIVVYDFAIDKPKKKKKKK